jgi:penicillin-binding protein 1C
MGRLAHASAVVLDRRGDWLRALPTDGGRWRLRADLSRIDPVFVRRLIALEDRRFWSHGGVDPLALARAALADVSSGRIRSGGSTLTMQLARRLDPRPRTLPAKLLEAVRAWELEARLGRRGVLAAYLTLAPYGGNLEGVRAASLAYFGHEPTGLTDAEQALLIALPQAPEARRPDRSPAAAKAARAHVLARLVARGLISPRAAAEADAEPLPSRRAFPVRAWAATAQIARGAAPAQPTVVSTLDAGLQARLEALAGQAAAEQGAASSAAVLVVETATRSVRAAVSRGGRDGDGAWVDMTSALRSPGSALKPFLYAMAFEQGLATPETRLADSPVAFDGYEPENFDRAFHGEVTARQALAQSLNVPAVMLMSRVGPAGFEARLHGAGAELVRPREGLADPGLALALGGEGITLRDLAMLYAALADGGIARPLAWTRDQAGGQARRGGRRLVSAGAAREVLDILREGPAPPGRAPAALSERAPRIAFKTGTSYGFRDALAAGVDDRWTVVVWTGRADGGARPGKTGRAAALPLLFEVFDTLAGDAGASHARSLQAAPTALTRLGDADDGPSVLFPPEGAEVLIDRFGPASRGLALAGKGQGLRWYVDGAPIAPGLAGGEPVWRPSSPGFYVLTAVDSAGRRALAHVRVR